jgi:hypothetical protein
MSYRPSSNPPVTRWARHLDTVMRERQWSRVRLFEEIAPDMGWSPKSRSAMLPLLEDREPTPAQADVLARHFGEPPESQEPPADSAHTEAGGSLALAAAIDRQSAAMEAQARAFVMLAESIDRAAQGVTGRVAGFEELLTGLLVAVRQQPATDAGATHDAPARHGR